MHLLIKNNAKFAEIYIDTFPSPVDDKESLSCVHVFWYCTVPIHIYSSYIHEIFFNSTDLNWDFVACFILKDFPFID